jgi:dihydrofolate reductase
MGLRVSVFVATSLDGFIARADGSIDWLEAVQASLPAGEDCGFQAFFDAIDVLVLGRHTFELVLGFAAWPYGDKPVVVLSRWPVSIPTELRARVSHSSADPAELCKRLAKGGLKHAYVDGGLTIQGFLGAGVVDELTVTLIPVLLGQGKPLFGRLAHDVRLQHLGTRGFPGGLQQVRYRVLRAPAASASARKLDEVLRFLDEQRLRATYGAVAEVLGVPARTMGRRLGARRHEASWVVNARSGRPTGYADHELHPQLLSNPELIRSGDDLARRVVRHRRGR